MDQNGDGSMSLAEFRDVLGPLFRALAPAEQQTLLDYFDTDGSGEIDFREFVGLMGSKPHGEVEPEDAFAFEGDA